MSYLYTPLLGHFWVNLPLGTVPPPPGFFSYNVFSIRMFLAILHGLIFLTLFYGKQNRAAGFRVQQ